MFHLPFGDCHLFALYRPYHLNEGETNVLKMSQLKRTGNKVLLKGGVLEDAITAAITAMNEPKTCSTTTLRRYLIDANKDRKQYQLGKRLLFCNYFMVPGTENVLLFGSSKSTRDLREVSFSFLLAYKHLSARWHCKCP